MQLFLLAFAYLFFMNIVGLVLMYCDKKRAVKGKWRIKEKTLFSIALLGGSVGVLLGCKRFHHKTLHKLFRYGIPSIITFQIAVLIFTAYWFFV